ncbi:MAG: phage portal protein [Pseudomonadota bacterium]
MRWPWQKRQPLERRASGSGYTSEIIAAREAYIAGRTGLGETTAVVQSCVSLWESGLSLADVEGTDLLTPPVLAMTARSLALRGEALFVIGDRGLIPATDWDTRTRDGIPQAYRLSIPEAGGGRSETRLAAEVLHIRLAADIAAPWMGQAPLRRASLSAGTLHSLEAALGEVYAEAPLGSSIVPTPELPEPDRVNLSRGFRGQRGRVLLTESVNVSAAGGPTPVTDWKPQGLSPDLQRTEAMNAWSRAQESIANVFGVLPALLNAAATGPVVREAQRHLAQWMLQPIANLTAHEATEKLGVTVKLDVLRPTQSWDAGGRARALNAIVQALANAEAAGLPAAKVAQAFAAVDWQAPSQE